MTVGYSNIGHCYSIFCARSSWKLVHTSVPHRPVPSAQPIKLSNRNMKKKKKEPVILL